MRYWWITGLVFFSACQKPAPEPAETKKTAASAQAAQTSAALEPPSTPLEVSNPGDKPRKAANVTLALSELGSVPAWNLALFEGEQELPLQVDDVDADGNPDTLAFQVDLGPKETKRLELVQKPPKRFPKRTRAVVHQEYEGPGWESDLVAYRLYLDGRNAIDVFGKMEPMLSLDRYAKSGKTYHEIEPWGVDVLHVGDSLGVGGFGFWINDEVVKPVETLRTGEQKPLRRFVEIVAEGPVRSILRISYDNWVVDKEPRKVTSTMTIWAGKRWARSDLDLGSDFQPKVAVGIVAIEGAPVTQKDGLFFTYGLQSDPISDTKKPERLGLGVVFPKQEFSTYVDQARTAALPAAKDSSHVAVLTPDDQGHVYWGYLAAWERGSLGIRDPAAMQAECETALFELTNPISARRK